MSDTKPHAELPPLERTREYKDAATQWAEEFDWSDTDWEYVAEEQHANFICRTMQLLAALQSIAALTARAEKAERERDEAKRLHNLRAELHDRAVIAAEAAEADCEVWRKAGAAQQKRAEAAESELASLRTSPSEGGDGYGNC